MVYMWRTHMYYVHQEEIYYKYIFCFLFPSSSEWVWKWIFWSLPTVIWGIWKCIFEAFPQPSEWAGKWILYRNLGWLQLQLMSWLQAYETYWIRSIQLNHTQMTDLQNTRDFFKSFFQTTKCVIIWYTT